MESVYGNVIHFHFLCMFLTLWFPLLVSMHHIPPDKVLDWYQGAFVPQSNGEVLQHLNKLFTSFSVQSLLSGGQINKWSTLGVRMTDCWLETKRGST